MAAFSSSPTTTTTSTTAIHPSSPYNYKLHKHSSSSSTLCRLSYHLNTTNYSPRYSVVLTKCNPSTNEPANTSYNISSETSSYSADDNSKLQVGSAVIVVEAPRIIKTATSIPSLRVNSGLVNSGDVGRIVARKPKDVWAVRLRIGTYLIDGKYFRPLDIDG